MLGLRSTLKSKVLNFFFLNESRRVYINELARLLSGDPKNVYRVLSALEAEGVLNSQFRGKERYFAANRNNPLYRGYRELFMKTAGLEALLREELSGVEGLKEAYIFGSYARGEYGPDSDIDILLVGSHERLSAQRILFAMQKKLGREVSAVHMSPEDLEEKKSRGDQFVATVFGGKVIKIL